MSLYLAAGGLQSILLPVRARVEGFSDLSIGHMGGMYSVGFVAGCLIVPRILARVGHIRTHGVMAAIIAFVVLLFGMWVDNIGWVVMRAATGFCFAGGAMIAESWLNEQAANETRGTILSAYMVVNLVAITAGQMGLALGDPSAAIPFMACAMLCCAALVPTALCTGRVPSKVTPPKLSLKRLFQYSPVGVVGCFCIGLGNGAFGTLGAVYTQQLGFSATAAASFMNIAIFGGALTQFPVGKLSDKVDRRYVLIGVCIGAAIAAAVFVSGIATSTMSSMILALCYGAMVSSMYSLAVAHANDFTPSGSFVETSSGLLICMGTGATLGPVIASIAMSAVGSAGLFMSTFVFYVALATFALIRSRQRKALPPEQRGPFIAAPRQAGCQ